MWKIFIELKKVQLPTDEIPAYARQKLKSYGDLFILNISSTRDTDEEGYWTGRWSNYSIKKEVDQLGPDRGIRSVIANPQ
jgi:hypothetical protein